jgi:hypothetical protein
VGKRAWIVVGVVAAVIVASLAAVYLTGLIIVGDPFSGLWNTDGADTEYKTTGSLIKHTDDGYVFTALVGGEVNGWHPLEQDRRTLSGEWNGERFIFTYQPWSGHLVWTYWDHDTLRVRGMVLKKVTSDTSVPTQVD